MAIRRNSMTAVSLFSGAGGMDVGFSKAGFEIVLANDIDPDACATYRLNHSNPIFEGSLLDLNVTDHVREVDLVFGGPPCQGFSVAGKMDPDDDRSKLIHHFFDVIDDLRPRAFVCENVKALAALNRWRHVKDALLKRGRKHYKVALLVLNAANYGVAQIRERMFIVGLRKDVFEGDEASLQKFLMAELHDLEEIPPTISEIVKSLGRPGSRTNGRTCAAKITYAKAPVMRKSPYAGMLFNGAGRPLPAQGSSTTLPASMGGNKTPIVDDAEIFDGEDSFVEEYHRRLSNGGKPFSGEAPKRLRRLTVDECLAIQTFPKGYNLAGSQSAMYRQIGNAVPSKLAEAVARSVFSALEIASSNRTPGFQQAAE